MRMRFSVCMGEWVYGGWGGGGGGGGGGGVGGGGHLLLVVLEDEYDVELAQRKVNALKMDAFDVR